MFDCLDRLQSLPTYLLTPQQTLLMCNLIALFSSPSLNEFELELRRNRKRVRTGKSTYT